MHRARLAAMGEEFAKLPGTTPEQGKEAAKIFSQIDTVKVVAVGDHGQPIAPLRDDQPVTELDSFLNKNEMKRGMSAYRDWVERQEQALLAELQATEERQQAEVQAISDQKAAEVKSFIAEEPVQPQPDALAQERAALQAERQATAQLRQMSVAEQKLVENINQWDRWAAQFPEMRDDAAFEQMVRTNPERHQQFMQARQRRDAAEQRLRELQQVRAAGEMQIAARAAVANQQQVTAWANQQDEIFERELQRRHPAYSDGAGLVKLQTAAKEYMRNDMGLSQAEIDRQWK